MDVLLAVLLADNVVDDDDHDDQVGGDDNYVQSSDDDGCGDDPNNDSIGDTEKWKNLCQEASPPQKTDNLLCLNLVMEEVGNSYT